MSVSRRSVSRRNRQPIGVFDSGVGGLTVLHALQQRLPHEDFLYLGDTARLPYGTKSAGSVVRYALQAACALTARDIKLLVVACNAASAVALEALAAALAPVPVIGVIDAGARASCRMSASGHIGVLATEGTIRVGAYERAILRRRPAARVRQQACPLFVALAEEGWLEGDLVEGIVAHALTPLLQTSPADRPDCLVLGCTHFPVLAGPIHRVVGDEVTLVDSAVTTAEEVEAMLRSMGLDAPANRKGKTAFLATDGAERFARVGGIFLGRHLDAAEVELIDLATTP